MIANKKSKNLTLLTKNVKFLPLKPLVIVIYKEKL